MLSVQMRLCAIALVSATTAAPCGGGGRVSSCRAVIQLRWFEHGFPNQRGRGRRGVPKGEPALRAVEFQKLSGRDPLASSRRRESKPARRRASSTSIPNRVQDSLAISSQSKEHVGDVGHRGRAQDALVTWIPGNVLRWNQADSSWPIARSASSVPASGTYDSSTEAVVGEGASRGDFTSSRRRTTCSSRVCAA